MRTSGWVPKEYQEFWKQLEEQGIKPKEILSASLMLLDHFWKKHHRLPTTADTELAEIQGLEDLLSNAQFQQAVISLVRDHLHVAYWPDGGDQIVAAVSIT